jgi:hypothetical protein
MEEITWKPMHRWQDNIKMDLEEIVWTGFMWFRIGTSGVGSSEHGNESLGSMKGGTLLTS